MLNKSHAWGCFMSIRVILQITVVLLLSVLSLHAQEPWAPPGFDRLSDQEVSELSVYYKNKYLGDVIAEFDNEKVKILNPQVLSKPLADYVNDPFVILDVMSRSLDANAELACKTRSLERACPYLDPQIVGYILNRSQYRLDLYIAPEYLLRSTYDGSVYYTQPSSTDWVYSSQFSSSLLGNTTQIFANIINNQFISKGPFNIFANITYNYNTSFERVDYTNDFFLNNLNASYEKNRQQHMFGFIPAKTTMFGEQANIFGYGLTTISRLMHGRNGLIGTPINIEVSVPSVVTFFVNSQIIFTKSFDTGIHRVDGSNFPDGSYTITAVFNDINGDSHTETFPFTKSSVDPTVGYPEYNFFVGVNRGATAEIYPTISDEWFVSANYAYRYSKRLAIYFESSCQDSLTLAVGPGFYWARQQYLRPMVGMDTNAGLLYSVTAKNQWRSLTTVWTASRVKDGVYDSNELYSVNVNYNTGRYGDFNLTYSNNSSGDDSAGGSRYSYAFSRSFVYPQSWRRPIRFDFQFGYTPDRSFVRLGFEKYLNESKGHKSVLRSDISHSSDIGQPVYGHGFIYDYEADLTPEASVTAAANIDSDSFSINSALQYRIRNNRVRLQNTFRHHFDGVNEMMTDVSVARDDTFGYVYGQHGLRFMRRMPTSTGVVVIVEGLKNNSDVVLQVRGREYPVKANGQSVFIPIPIYTPSKVLIDYRGDQAFHFESGAEKDLVLFPGNVAFLRFQAKPIYTLFASFSCGGIPLANKAIYSSVDETVTDVTGFASLEVSYDDLVRVYGQQLSDVQFSLSQLRPEDGFVYSNELICSQGAGSMKSLTLSTNEDTDNAPVPFSKTLEDGSRSALDDITVYSSDIEDSQIDVLVNDGFSSSTQSSDIVNESSPAADSSQPTPGENNATIRSNDSGLVAPAARDTYVDDVMFTDQNMLEQQPSPVLNEADSQDYDNSIVVPEDNSSTESMSAAEQDSITRLSFANSSNQQLAVDVEQERIMDQLISADQNESHSSILPTVPESSRGPLVGLINRMMDNNQSGSLARQNTRHIRVADKDVALDNLQRSIKESLPTMHPDQRIDDQNVNQETRQPADAVVGDDVSQIADSSSDNDVSALNSPVDDPASDDVQNPIISPVLPYQSPQDMWGRRISRSIADIFRVR